MHRRGREDWVSSRVGNYSKPRALKERVVRATHPYPSERLFSYYFPWQCLYFIDLPSGCFAPQGHGSFRPILSLPGSTACDCGIGLFWPCTPDFKILSTILASMVANNWPNALCPSFLYSTKGSRPEYARKRTESLI